MSPPPQYKGLVASAGLARGPVFVVEAPAVSSSGTSFSAEELQGALLSASTQLSELMGSASGEAAEILEFQWAMLEDESLSEGALAQCASGVSADVAWSTAMQQHIEDYEQSDNAYFQARSSDLRDIRDRVLRALHGTEIRQVPPGAVVAAQDLTPSRFLETDWQAGGGVVLTEGSPASHVAMLARARGVPMLVGVSELNLADLPEGTEVLLDADAALLNVEPDAEALAGFSQKLSLQEAQMAAGTALLDQPAVSADGVRVQVLLNIALPEEVRTINPDHCDGIGLMRSEFLFNDGPPSEEQQYQAYRVLLEWAQGQPVVVRTLDAGGDKPIPGLNLPSESNPFLGVRGLRWSLKNPEVFRVQVRALCRAAVHGALKVMVPMITHPSEFDEAQQLFQEVARELEATQVPHRLPPLGMMIEVPAAALAPELFAQAEFFSIGSNDLVQYLTASARDLSSVAELCDPGHPAVLKVIRELTRFCESSGQELSLCGDMGSDPRYIEALLHAGVRVLSIAPARLGATKLAIRNIRAQP